MAAVPFRCIFMHLYFNKKIRHCYYYYKAIKIDCQINAYSCNKLLLC